MAKRLGFIMAFLVLSLASIALTKAADENNSTGKTSATTKAPVTKGTTVAPPPPTTTAPPKPATTAPPKPTTPAPPPTTTTDPPKSTTTDPPKATTTDPPKSTTTDPPKSTTTDPPKSTTTDPPKPTTTDPPKSTTTDPPKSTTTDPPKPTTTDPPKSTPTDPPKPTTTDPPKSTTTDPPKSTTTDPPKPTTTDPPKSTTTDPPKSTTTAPALTTTASPTLPPLPPKQSFNVSGVNGTVLRLIVGARITINATSAAADDDDAEAYGLKALRVVDLPADAAIEGTASSVTLKFGGMDFKLEFGEGKDAWDLSNVSLTYAKGKTASVNAKDANGVAGIHAHKGNAFACKAEQDVTLGDEVKVTILDLRVQPFLTGDKSDFGKSESCEADKARNNVVPIAVGAALAALVVLVLVMYLIGRRRHQRGYQTV